MMRRWIAIAATVVALACSSAPPLPTGYDAELARIDDEIAAAAPERLIHLLYARASLTGDFADFARVEREIDRAVATSGAVDELRLFRASLSFKVHRLAAAKDELAALSRLAGAPYVRTLRADIALQEGRYDEAREAYEDAVAEERTWENLSRLAYYLAKTGDPARADALYAEAQDELTAKEMRAFAWLELQRGLLDLDAHRYEQALAHYRRADRAYSGFWLIEEHVAEALDLLGRTDEAIELYERVIARTKNPEFVSALAAILARSDAAAAERLFARADEMYEERYARYPEAAVGHYIDHLLERTGEGTRALELARRNHELRPNADAKLLLAKAYVKANQPAPARALLAEVGATPWRPSEYAELLDALR